MICIYSPQTRPPRLSEAVIGEAQPMRDAAVRDGGQGRRERKGCEEELFTFDDIGPDDWQDMQQIFNLQSSIFNSGLSGLGVTKFFRRFISWNSLFT